MIRTIQTDEITKNIKEMCIQANHYLSADMDAAMKHAADTEQSELGKKILNQLQDNLKIADEEMIPICQDTGMAVIFLEVGQDVHFEGTAIEDAVNEGVRQGYTEGFLRKSVVGDPLIRENTKDNTPAVIHYSIVPGDQVKITMAPKGFGSENMSRVFMLKPADSIEGVKHAILTAVKDAGPNACPPMVVGVGIGGTFEKCALLAKQALTRPVDELHHAVGELQDGPRLTLRHTAECMERPARYAGRQGEVGHLTHVILLFRLQRSNLGPAGGADAVTLILGHVGRQLAAEIAAAGGTVLFEDDLIALHEDLELRVLVDVHIGAQLLGEDDAAQRIDAPNDASCFHIHFSFSVCPERWQNEHLLRRHNAKNVPVQEKQENSVNLFLFSIQKVESFVNLNGQIRQKLLKEAKSGGQDCPSLLSPLTNRAGEGKLRQRYLQFICR